MIEAKVEKKQDELEITSLNKLFTLLLLYKPPNQDQNSISSDPSTEKKEPGIHGYAIMEAIKEEELKASPGQIYPFLSTLTEKGYVESLIEKQGDREKKVYHLTPSGKKFVERLLNRFGVLIDIAVEPKLTVCASCGAKIYDGAHIETVHGQELAFCCIHCAKSYKQQLES